MKKYSSKIKKYVIMVIIVYFMIMLIETVISITDSKKIQLMNKLNFDISLNEDGSMNVTETWDIYVKNTGTLFKDFYETDRYPITDVTVKNLDTNTDFANVGEVIYDVPNGMYYAESIDDYGTDEIAFGTGMEQSSGNQRYQISYKISNVINTYVDCQEFYWKFLDESNNVPCKEITGKIKLPDGIKNPENLKAWGHGNLKGKINIPSSNEVDFKVENLNAENMLEIRIMTTDKIFNTSELSDEFYDSDSILVEEKKWANQTNRKIILLRIFVILLLLIYVLLIIYFISKIYRFLKALCKNDTKISNEKIKYFRDIPREKSATPGEAEYLYFFKKNIEIDDVNQSNLLASYILDLCQKRYISIEKKKENLYISIIKNSDGLKSDEKEIYQLLEQAMDLNNKKTIEVKKLKEFAKSDDFNEHIKKMKSNIKQNLYNEKLLDKEKDKVYKESKSNLPIIFAGIIIALIVYFAIGLIPRFYIGYVNMWGLDICGRFLDSIILLAPLAILLILFYIVSKISNKNIYKLTQKGEDERVEWKGLAKYLKDYSLIQEKGVFDVVLWEKYLVFATAFGISKKVIEQLHTKYPDVFTEEYWNEQKETQEILNMACNPTYINTNCDFDSFTSDIQSSYRTMISTITAEYASTSGGGSGGGFSSGGGGGGGGAGMGGR